MTLFDLFKEFCLEMGIDVLELSVKQHQISLIVKEGIMNFSQIQEVLKKATNIDESYVTTHNDNLIIIFGGLSIESFDKIDIFSPFIALIKKFSEEICQCPSLEYAVSESYIKCYLDKPGLRVSDLQKYEDILKLEGKGELVLHPQRPYLLFINENFEIE